MQYKASLDRMAKIMTSGIIILFIFLGYRSLKGIDFSRADLSTVLLSCGTIVFFVVILIICYLLAPQYYKVDDGELTIVRPVSNVKIKLTDIAEIRSMSQQDLKGTIRTFGVGGLFGYYGKYYHSKIGHLTFFATKRKNLVLIQDKKGKKIVITPDDINLLENLKGVMLKF